MLKFQLLPIVFLGGGIGASLRWILSSLVNQMVSRVWLGTLSVNLLGCMIYFLAVRFDWYQGKTFQPFVIIGILGSLTTFSTFTAEIVFLLKNHQPQEAMLVFALNILFGVFIGIGILFKEFI
jgi:fluoride exporter